MKSEYPLPVRYVLYTHYAEGNDFQDYRENKTPVSELSGVDFLVRHLSGLRGLLTWSGYEGMLVLFYAPGLDECLDGIANHKSLQELQTCKGLEFATAVHEYVDTIMNEKYPELLPRLRFFTALDLYRVFGRIRNSDIADRLRPWMVGDTKAMTYDSPKIVEAIVRLRLLGTGVPVFRVDHDVLLRGEENCEKKNLEFSSTVGSCLTAYQVRRDSPNLSSFIFSASYDHKMLSDAESSNDFHAWGRAYATRVFPVLSFNQSLISETLESIDTAYKHAQKTIHKEAKAVRARVLKKKLLEITAQAWDCYASKTFNAQLARKFFGFNAEGCVASDLEGIGQIGAHPMASVISGAMLYLSDGAILDLPPFSNFSLNVSWIDDHLKYCMHRELRHLKPPTLEDDVREARRSNLLTYSKIDDVIVQKAGRKIDKDLRGYIFDVYLPTVLRGTILDAWITPDPLLKYRPEELTEKNRDTLRERLSKTHSGGLLPSALQHALAACRFTRDARFKLKRQLEASALNRITQVRRQWVALTENGVDTFASIWAKGLARSRCEDLELKYPGIVRDHHLSAEAELTADDLSQSVTADLRQLIEDACDYIEWTRDWPTIVQVVRSIEQGTLRTDLNYDPERASSVEI